MFVVFPTMIHFHSNFFFEKKKCHFADNLTSNVNIIVGKDWIKVEFECLNHGVFFTVASNTQKQICLQALEQIRKNVIPVQSKCGFFDLRAKRASSPKGCEAVEVRRTEA